MTSSLAQRVAEALGLPKTAYAVGTTTRINLDPEHDWNHIKLVLEEMAKRGFDFVLHVDQDGDGFAEFLKEASIWSSDFEATDDLGTAVCEAALEALGGGKG